MKLVAPARSAKSWVVTSWPARNAVHERLQGQEIVGAREPQESAPLPGGGLIKIVRSGFDKARSKTEPSAPSLRRSTNRTSAASAS